MRVSARAKELSGKVEDQIRFHPDTHDQTTWGSKTTCRTTACVAGWACELSGHPLLYNLTDPLQALTDRIVSHYCSAPDYSFAYSEWLNVEHILNVDNGVDEVDPGFVGQKLLGLNQVEAEWLFWEYRTREEVLSALQTIRKGDADGLQELLKIGNPSSRYFDDDEEE